ncbi:MAG: hypothetical protein ACT4QA_22220 [Panacagrimonas sp.]
MVQRPVLYLGEINGSQHEAWMRSIEAFDKNAHCKKRLTQFPSDRELPGDRADAVHVRLSEFELRRPRPWGACGVFGQFWEQLGLDCRFQSFEANGCSGIRPPPITHSVPCKGSKPDRVSL